MNGVTSTSDCVRDDAGDERGRGLGWSGLVSANVETVRMDRPRIKPGLLQGLNQRVIVSLFVACWFVCGCVSQSGKSKPKPKKPAGTTLSAIAFDSFQARDRLRAEKLRRVADDVKAGRLKYDGPVMEAIEKVGAEASRESWQPVADQLAKLLGEGSNLDATKCEQAIRDLADGAERAGK